MSAEERRPRKKFLTKDTALEIAEVVNKIQDTKRTANEKKMADMQLRVAERKDTALKKKEKEHRETRRLAQKTKTGRKKKAQPKKRKTSFDE
ncbi:MAG: uncharacterized protein A8A55_1305 [Amphiamblys sp. WSBS2006]|nr:MAG: uncharacterized protein A8A55_1305 [Amphiamblys sp. WSBS2006]